MINKLNEFLKTEGVLITEGHIGECQDYVNTLFNIVNNSKNIVDAIEIGMNSGHSAVTMLSGSWQLNLVSFDLGSHNYVLTAKKFIDTYFPGRHTLIIGNSMTTVNNYANITDRKYDLIFIDGGHDKNCCYSDLINCKRLAHENTLIILDDYVEESIERHNIGPKVSWDELVSMKFIEQIEVVYFGNNRGFVSGKYVF